MTGYIRRSSLPQTDDNKLQICGTTEWRSSGQGEPVASHYVFNSSLLAQLARFDLDMEIDVLSGSCWPFICSGASCWNTFRAKALSLITHTHKHTRTASSVSHCCCWKITVINFNYIFIMRMATTTVRC